MDIGEKGGLGVDVTSVENIFTYLWLEVDEDVLV
jgi:hypothetical protein